jgi:UDP-GlcNAc:undecaprenyl-phosphate GlcNAc-1-phosphate transferase
VWMGAWTGAWAGIRADTWPSTGWICAGFAATLLLGLLDDRQGLSARGKFITQVLIAGCTLAPAGLLLAHLGEWLPGWQPRLVWLALPVTVFGVVSVMNALNMADGVDGLAGGLSVAAFTGLGLTAAHAGNQSAFQTSALGIAVLAGFLVFNLRFSARPARVFMGDAGSLSLGYLIAAVALWLCLSPTNPVPPAVALWSVALPLIDGLAVIVGRYRAHRGLTSPGRDHLHHRLLNRGFSVNQVVLIEVSLGLAGSVGALAAWRYGLPAWTLTVVFLVTALGYTVKRSTPARRGRQRPAILQPPYRSSVREAAPSEPAPAIARKPFSPRSGLF